MTPINTNNDIKKASSFLMMSSFMAMPLLLIAAYNFHMAKVVQHHPLAQQMLTFTVLLIGVLTVMGLIGFLTFMFSKEISGKINNH
ncbi:MAG: hypothetical protein WC998_07735 [Candidatus Paceibacterota bacterium]